MQSSWSHTLQSCIHTLRPDTSKPSVLKVPAANADFEGFGCETVDIKGSNDDFEGFGRPPEVPGEGIKGRGLIDTRAMRLSNTPLGQGLVN